MIIPSNLQCTIQCTSSRKKNGQSRPLLPIEGVEALFQGTYPKLGGIFSNMTKRGQINKKKLLHNPKKDKFTYTGKSTDLTVSGS